MIDTAWEMKQPSLTGQELKDAAQEAEHWQPEVPDTNIRTGLSSREAEQRLLKYGFNEIEEDEARDTAPLWKLFVMQLTSYMILLLLIAAVASFALQQIPEGIAIIVIVVANASIAVYTEKSAANALAALSDMSQPSSTVLRDGETKTIPTKNVVVGDVLLVEAGDIIAADAQLVASADLKINEMPLTGEPTDVTKTHAPAPSDSKALTPPNHLFSGTTVTAGTGLAIVFATGMHTRVGRIAAMLTGEDVERNWLGLKPPKLTPLQHRLKSFGMLLSVAAITAAVIVFFVGAFAREYRDPEHPDTSPVLEMVLVAVTLAVSAIPESLPLCVTVVLAVGTQQMARQENCLVRHLPAVETLGSANVICSDKTGTLTEGKMTALKIWCLGPMVTATAEEERDIKVTGQGLLPIGELVEDGHTLQDPGQTDVQISTCIASAVLNSTALLKVKDRDAEGGVRSLHANELQREDFSAYALTRQWVAEGNTTEVPLVVLGGKVGIFRSLMSREHPSIGVERGAKVGPEVPFSSDRKVMISVVRANEARFHKLHLPVGTKYVALLKGAPNYLINKSTTAIYQDEFFGPFREEARRRVTRAVDDLSGQALRVLAVAIRPLQELPYDPIDTSVDAQQKFDLLYKDLTFVGLIASLDPEREGVSDAIQVARKAGVRTVMITGDYLRTAIAIAKNIGLITVNDDPENVAVDCKTLRPFDNEYLAAADMDEVTTRCVVFARAQPADKLEIVKSLRRQGFVTGMTGDGVNDAPALHEANIGVAMGINGTEVAKAASDMVLLDDNFVTLVAAIRKGRQIYANVQKFVIYFIGTNAATVSLILLGVFVGVPIPFLPLVILFLNLAIDGTCSMSIAVQPPEERIMDEEPRPLHESLITPRMWFIALSHALVLTIVTGIAYLAGLYWFTGAVLTDDLLEGSNLRDHCKIYHSDGTWETETGSHCVREGLEKARTMAFITVVYSETLRAFTVKSLAPFYDEFFANRWLLLAVATSAILATLILFVPGLSDVFGLVGLELEWWAWLTCVALVFVTVAYDEYIKYRVRRSEKKRAEKLKVEHFFTSMQAEMRQLRHHLIELETNLKLREERPSRRVVLQESAQALAHALAVHGIGSEQVYQLVAQEPWTQSTYRENVLHNLEDPEA